MPYQPAGGDGRQVAAGGDRAGEGDASHHGEGRERGAHVGARACHHVEQAVGQPRLGGQAGKVPAGLRVGGGGGDRPVDVGGRARGDLVAE
jgi:hypothetical protein